VRRDPHLATRLRNEAMYRRHEKTLDAALVTAMTEWLDTARALVLHQPLPALTAASDIPGKEFTANVTPTLTAAAGQEPPDIDAAQASFTTWARALTEHVEPAITEAFGEAFRANLRTANISPQHYQEQHLADVHDRLVIWPEGAFEELRPELLEALAEGESMEQVEERIGRTLNIDAPARRIRADISAIDRRIADPLTPPGDIPKLRARRRDLWNQHDERNLEWQWLARRIARTEIQGAMNGGTLAAARAAEEASGERMYKRWLATTDERVRATHAVADGQMVRLSEPFTVGGFPVQHPADPFAPPQESINCRCSMMIFTAGETQAELQGQWGGLGVGPGHARLGPDAPEDAAADRFEAEQDGQVQERPVRGEPDSVPVETVPDPPEPDSVPVVVDVAPDNAPPVPVVDDPDPVDPAPVEPEPADEDGEDALTALLDGWYAHAEQELTDEDRATITRWQGMDRFYEKVQGTARQTISPDDPDLIEAEDVRDRLQDIAEQFELPAPIEVYRGVRASQPTFGVANADLPSLIGQTIPMRGFTATTTSREVAIEQFTQPNAMSRGGHVLMKLRLPPGVPAIWLPAVGAPEFADQSELLLGLGISLLLTQVEYTGSVPEVTAEVIEYVDDSE
jgi:hypothetical protein